MRTIKRTSRLDIDYLAMAILSALGFYQAFRWINVVDLSFEALFVYATGAGILTALILRLFGYFDELRLFPRKSDLFPVSFAAVAAAGIQLQVMRALFDLTVAGWGQTLVGGLCVGIGAFIIHYAFGWAQLINNRRRRIVLKLLPHERQATKKDFDVFGLSKYIDFLSYRDLKRSLSRGDEEIDLIIISRGALRKMDADGWLMRAHLAGVPIVDRRQIFNRITGRIKLSDMDQWSYLLAATPQTLMLRLNAQLKVWIEPVLGAAMLVLFSPLMLFLAGLIKVTSRGPVFYTQLRTGYLGQDFYLVKFRSMRSDSEANGIRWATKNDDRVTPIGRFLRKTRLDELPQLWNVMRGEMGFIGPRPERPEIYAELKKKIPLFPMRTIVRPGITGWAQVCAGYAASVEESKLKLEYDLYYIQHRSPRLDLIVFVKTLQVVLFGAEYQDKALDLTSTKKRLRENPESLRYSLYG